MKKSRQPLKRTELKRHTPLRSTTSISNGPVKPRKPGPMPKDEKRCRKLLPIRSGGVCETRVPGHCFGRAAVVSHRKRRSQSESGEKWSLTNVLHSCLPCELYLTEFGARTEVRKNGWTLPSTVDPSEALVLRRHLWTVLFDKPDADGRLFRLATQAEIDDWLGAERAGGAAVGFKERDDD